jgi:hypothetical protein
MSSQVNIYMKVFLQWNDAVAGWLKIDGIACLLDTGKHMIHK